MSDATTLDQLRRQAERRGLRIEYRPPRYHVTLVNSRASLYSTRRPEYLYEFLSRFRGRGR